MSEYEPHANMRPKAPEGYRHTGECRHPKAGEYFLDINRKVARANYAFKRGPIFHILEPVEPEPDYVEITVRLPKPEAGYGWHWDATIEEFILRPTRKLLDWSKVGPDVLVIGNFGLTPKSGATSFINGFYSGWQAHLGGGECPVDPVACKVEVRYLSGGTAIDLYAGEVLWGDVTAYRVTGLAPGYEYP